MIENKKPHFFISLSHSSNKNNELFDKAGAVRATPNLPKSIWYQTFGSLQKVLKLNTSPIPIPKPDEVLVKMKYASIKGLSHLSENAFH